ncbi:MAG: GDP-mannose 4,6-dehydratase [Acidobacteria bacterium]|nr:GDP-mannose 4,6-dehydratase [Acidobacteriota bacterium]MBI3280552.1 GDP-mannose 4,6-dehydratase [Acidobacteriota bacterium]
MKKALITGITGQDGSFLAEFLLAKDYEVHGLIRRASTFNTDRLDSIYIDPHERGSSLHLHYGDLTDGTGTRRVIEKVQPDEIYNLAAQSHVRVSFDQAEYTADVVATGTLRLLEAVRDYVWNTGREVRFYQAGSSEMFGAATPPQNETTPFYPRSPYAVSKVAAHWYAVNYREAYGLFICNGILFNHESPRRGETFVTRKITRALARIKCGRQEKLYLGNLEARRDWGYAGDFIEAMWLMLQHGEAGDYVVATGESHSVREFLDVAGDCCGVAWNKHVEIDSRYFRPTEVDFLLGDASKARRQLGWRPRMSFPELVRMMMEHDLELARQEQTLAAAGHRVITRGASHA